MRMHEREGKKKIYSNIRRNYEQRRWNEMDDQSWGVEPNRAQGTGQDFGWRHPLNWDNRIFDRDVDRGADYFEDYEVHRRWVSAKDAFGKGPKGYQRRGDLILEDACEALTRNSAVDARQIEVSVENGCVFLQGEVENRQMKKKAEECVENISGVRDVMNKLKILGAGNGMNDKT